MIIDIQETWSGEDGRGDWSTRNRRRVWDVLTDSMADNSVTIGDDPRFPRPGTAHPLDTFCRVIDKSVKRVGGPFHWNVECQYQAYFPGSGFDATKGDDPSGFPIDVEWDFLGWTEEIDCDINGHALLNSARYPFSGLKSEGYDQVLRISGNYLNYNAGLAWQYCSRPTVNADIFCGAAPGTVKCGPITGRLVRWRGFSFYRVNYMFLFRLDGWKRHVLQQGPCCWDPEAEGDVAVWKWFPNSRIQLLGDDGQPLAKGAAPVFTGTVQNPDFVTCQSLPFSVFGIVLPA